MYEKNGRQLSVFKVFSQNFINELLGILVSKSLLFLRLADVQIVISTGIRFLVSKSTDSMGTT